MTLTDVERACRALMARAAGAAACERPRPEAGRRAQRRTATTGNPGSSSCGSITRACRWTARPCSSRLSHGNLVQFGADHVAEVAIDRDALGEGATEAFAVALGSLGIEPRSVSETVDAGTLRLMTARPRASGLATGCRRRPDGDTRTGSRGSSRSAWRAIQHDQVAVDAHQGVLLGVRDLNQYVDAVVDGGVYARSQLTPEAVQGLPFATVTNSRTKITDSAGVYDYTGGTASVSLNGTLHPDLRHLRRDRALERDRRQPAPAA